MSIKETTEEEQSQPLMKVERQVRLETKTDNQLIYAAYEVRPSSGIVTRGVVVSDEQRNIEMQQTAMVPTQQTYMVEQPTTQQTYMVEQPMTMPSLQSELMPVLTQPSIGMQSYPAQTTYDGQAGLYQTQMTYEVQPQTQMVYETQGYSAGFAQQPAYDTRTAPTAQTLAVPSYGVQVGIDTQVYTTQQGGTQGSFVQQPVQMETSYAVQQNYLAPGQMQPGFNAVYTTQPGP